jgi:hypothetical protein
MVVNYFDTSTLGGWLTILGLIGFFVGVFLVLAPGGRGRKHVWLAMPIFAVVAFIGFGVTSLSPASVAAPTAPAQAQLNVVVASAPALPSGCTLYSSQYQVTCTTEYNYTSNAFCIVSSFAATHACKSGTNYILLPFKLIRTDCGCGNLNATFSFANTVTSIYTANSLGSNPQPYSPVVGFTAATSTSPGQWQLYPSAGTFASQKPTASAPGTTANVETTNIPIGTFATVTNTWHISLPGSNSTSAPATFAQALQNYTAYSLAFSFANAQGQSGTFTLYDTMIGWTT